MTTTNLTPISCEYTKDNLVKVGLKSTDGSVVHATMTATALVNLVNMATTLVNNRLAQVMADVSASPTA